MPLYTVTCVVSYRRTWSDVETESEEAAIELVQDDDIEADDWPGDCISVGGYEADLQEQPAAVTTT